jgi:hypothetical protein
MVEAGHRMVKAREESLGPAFFDVRRGERGPERRRESQERSRG